uniref:CSON015215 protein n=1 Tax=Culicoides sonorensis TaxID=179676 RepID=A0A336MCK7_CULSO
MMKSDLNSSGMSEGLRGQLYQIAISMLLFCRGTFRKLVHFKLETEVKSASCFDDVVFDEGNEHYRLIQLKHKTSKYKEKIKGSDLFQTKGDFSLLKYVNAWITVQNEVKFKNKVKNALIFTNIALDVDPETQTVKLQQKQKDMRELFQNVESIKVEQTKLDTSDILNVINHDNTKYYRFTDETVVDLLLRQIEIKMITTGNKATEKFVSDTILRDMIRDALKHIILACNQPDEEGIFDMVSDEIKEHFKLHSADVLFNKLKVCLTDWIKAKKVFNQVIEYDEARKFFEKNVKSICVDVTPPISTFVGREHEIQSIREMFEQVKVVAIYGLVEYFNDLKVLFVLDNVERHQITNKLNNLLLIIHTQKSSPHILITSRDRSVRINEMQHIDLNVLTVNEACHCINLQLNISQDDAKELAELLQCFPLVIQQATAFIKEQNQVLKVFKKTLTINQYIEMYHKKANTLLNFKTNDDFGLYSNTTLITWDITIETIQNEHKYGKNAIKILQLMSFLPPDNINPRIFLPLFQRDPIMNVANSIHLQEKYSMINQNDGYLQIHRLVQKVIQIKLAKNYMTEIILDDLTFILQHKFDQYQIQIQVTEHVIQEIIKNDELITKYSTMKFGHGGSLIHFIARNGNLNALKVISRQKNDINSKNDENETPLHLACFKANMSAVQFLLENHGDLDAQDNRGWSCVHRAAQSGNIKVLEYLLENGANLNAKDKIGRTVLHEAAMAGQINMIKFLVSKNIDLESRAINGRTVLHAAAFAGDIEMVQYLLSQGMDLYCTDFTGRTILHSATFGGRTNMIKYLVEVGLDLNVADDDGVTILHEAAYNGDSDVVSFLHENGSNLNAKDKSGKTAMHEAALGCQIDMIEILQNHGLDLNSKDNEGRTLIHMAGISGDIKLLEFLFSKGLNLNSRDIHGRTIIHFAAANNKMELIEFLLEKKYDINTKDYDGKTVIHWAVECHHPQMIKFLLENEVDLHEKDNQGRTALHWAAMTPNIAMIKFVLNLNFNLLTTDNEARSVLHWASLSGCVNMIEFLLNQGLNVNAIDKQGRTPLDWAKIGGSKEAINFLLKCNRANCIKNSIQKLIRNQECVNNRDDLCPFKRKLYFLYKEKAFNEEEQYSNMVLTVVVVEEEEKEEGNRIS